jgi:hypothetical protein
MAENNDIFAMSDAALAAAFATQKHRVEDAYARGKKRTATLTLLAEAVTGMGRVALLELQYHGPHIWDPTERRRTLLATLAAGTAATDRFVEHVAALELLASAEIIQLEERAKQAFHTAEAQKGVAALNAAGVRLMASRGIQPAGKAA